MKTHKKKISKVKSSSEEDSSDSSSTSSSSSSSTSSSDDSHKKKSAVLKRRNISESHSKDVTSKYPRSNTKYAEKEQPRKINREVSHKHRKIQNDNESHDSYRDPRERDLRDRDPRDRRERYRDNDHEKNRYETFPDRRDFRNDRERGDPDKYRRHRHNEQYNNNYNRNNHQHERERHRRTEETFHNQRHRDRNAKDYDDQRGGQQPSRNKRERSRSRSFDHTNAKWGRGEEEKSKKDKGKPAEREKPNFGLSGKLTEERNTFRGVVIKYSEPPEARKPKRRWRLYPFKGEKALQTLYIHRDSAYLIGRERKVVDLPVDHPSCSKQHAALQYRLVPFTREDGSTGKRVRPYLIDLESANGTYINNKKIDAKKYVELLERDVIKFGFSSREYVLLHENSKDEAQDDDVKQEDEEANVKNEPEG